MKRKVKTPLSYILWIIFFIIVALFFSFFTGIIEIGDVFWYIRAAVVSWAVLILLALIGAIFVGMFLSHRILSIGGFTPFEEEMLRMRGDINAINEKLDKLIDKDEGQNEEEKPG